MDNPKIDKKVINDVKPKLVASYFKLVGYAIIGVISAFFVLLLAGLLFNIASAFIMAVVDYIKNINNIDVAGLLIPLIFIIFVFLIFSSPYILKWSYNKFRNVLK